MKYVNTIKIGITERGDAACDLSWITKCEKALSDGSLNGAVIITKNLNKAVTDAILNLHRQGFPLIVHATTTGWGDTKLERCQPHWRQLFWVRHLLESGIPANRLVIRIDPIFPNETGLNKVSAVLREAQHLELLQEGVRLRISILDEYTHVKRRLLANGLTPLYGNDFYASPDMMGYTARRLARWAHRHATDNPGCPPITFETCAEDQLSCYVPQDLRNPFLSRGCISAKDLEVLGLPMPPAPRENMQNRKGCHCLDVKTELLKQRHPCPHKCLYCYWKD